MTPQQVLTMLVLMKVYWPGADMDPVTDTELDFAITELQDTRPHQAAQLMKFQTERRWGRA
jgi:hypothetical protein